MELDRFRNARYEGHAAPRALPGLAERTSVSIGHTYARSLDGSAAAVGCASAAALWERAPARTPENSQDKEHDREANGRHESVVSQCMRLSRNC